MSRDGEILRAYLPAEHAFIPAPLHRFGSTYRTSPGSHPPPVKLPEDIVSAAGCLRGGSWSRSRKKITVGEPATAPHTDMGTCVSISRKILEICGCFWSCLHWVHSSSGDARRRPAGELDRTRLPYRDVPTPPRMPSDAASLSAPCSRKHPQRSAGTTKSVQLLQTMYCLQQHIQQSSTVV